MKATLRRIAYGETRPTYIQCDATNKRAGRRCENKATHESGRPSKTSRWDWRVCLVHLRAHRHTLNGAESWQGGGSMMAQGEIDCGS